MAEQTPLTHLPRTLAEAGFDNPGYRALYEAARDARIPAKMSRGGRWTFCADDLPAIAEVMGLADAPANIAAA